MADLKPPARNVAGSYENSDWGRLQMAQSGDGITAHLGTLPMPLFFNSATGEIGADIIDQRFVATFDESSVVFRHGKSLELRFDRMTKP